MPARLQAASTTGRIRASPGKKGDALGDFSRCIGDVVRLFEPAPDSLKAPHERSSCVPNTDRPLPIPCPNASHPGCTLVVKSISVMTVECPNCRHSWAIELDALPEDIQQIVRAVLRDD